MKTYAIDYDTEKEKWEVYELYGDGSGMCVYSNDDFDIAYEELTAFVVKAKSEFEVTCDRCGKQTNYDKPKIGGHRVCADCLKEIVEDAYDHETFDLDVTWFKKDGEFDRFGVYKKD